MLVIAILGDVTNIGYNWKILDNIEQYWVILNNIDGKDGRQTHMTNLSRGCASHFITSRHVLKCKTEIDKIHALAARTYSIQHRGVSHMPLSSPDQLQGRLFQDDDIFTHPCIYLHPPLLYSSPTPAFVLLSAATLAPCWLAMWYWPRRNLGRKTCFRFWRKIDNVF